jgi:hypothetical protein
MAVALRPRNIERRYGEMFGIGLLPWWPVHQGASDVPRPGESKGAFEIRLEQNGWELIGEGTFGNVYEKDGQPDVLKVGGGKLDAWPAFAALVMTRHVGNPYALQVKSLEWFGDFYVARIERMDHTISRESNNPQRIEYSEMVSALRNLKYRKYTPTVRHLEHTRPELYRLLRDIVDFILLEADSDLHDENVMVAPDGRVVITDPAGYITSGSSSRELSTKISKNVRGQERQLPVLIAA